MQFGCLLSALHEGCGPRRVAGQQAKSDTPADKVQGLVDACKEVSMELTGHLLVPWPVWTQEPPAVTAPRYADRDLSETLADHRRLCEGVISEIKAGKYEGQVAPAGLQKSISELSSIRLAVCGLVSEKAPFEVFNIKRQRAKANCYLLEDVEAALKAFLVSRPSPSPPR
jgi:hypothetical protein